MTLPAFVTHAADVWGAYYGDHHLVSVSLRYLHLAGLVVGGGTALATDRDMLRAARRGAGERIATLAALARSHKTVLPSLAVVGITGLLMTFADLPTFLASRLFWTKMILVALLALNGAALLAAERALRHGGSTSAWTRLAVASGSSLVLWLVVLLVGTWLTVAA